jgi:hypothetical protein
MVIRGDHSESETVSLASYTGDASLTAAEFPGFGDRSCGTAFGVEAAGSRVGAALR